MTAWPASVSAQQRQVLYLFDASGSMNDTQGGERRIDSAKRAMLKSLASITPGTSVGLRVFAHRVPQSNKAESCLDTELVASIADQKTGALSRGIEGLTAKGYTPLAYAIQQAAKDFNTTVEASRVIILLSDGEETCGGDPVAELNKLKAQGINVTFYAIGFNVDSKSRAQLEELTKVGNGQYYDAKNAEELQAALAEATKQSLIIKKDKTIYGTEIRGGDAFETAVPLQFNKEYRLDHHQLGGDYDFFSLPIKKGQEITITLKTLEKGISIDKSGKQRETSNPAGGFELNAPDRTGITSQSEQGRYGKTAVVYNAAVDGDHYLLVGKWGWDLHKDGFTFTVDLAAKGDLNSETDAADSLKSAMPIVAGLYEKNYVGANDAEDVFSFKAEAGDMVKVTLIPQDNSNSSYYVKILSQLKQELKAESGKSGEGFKTDPVKITESGTYYLKVKNSGSSKLEEYSLELTIDKAAAAEESKLP